MNEVEPVTPPVTQAGVPPPPATPPVAALDTPAVGPSAVAAKPAAANRRIAIRRKPRGKVECRRGRMGFGPNLAEGWLDISETGARLSLKASVKKGEEVEVKLYSANRRQPFTVMADVMWCSPMENDRCTAGVQFQHRLKYGDFALLV